MTFNPGAEAFWVYFRLNCSWTVMIFAKPYMRLNVSAKISHRKEEAKLLEKVSWCNLQLPNLRQNDSICQLLLQILRMASATRSCIGIASTG